MRENNYDNTDQDTLSQSLAFFLKIKSCEGLYTIQSCINIA